MKDFLLINKFILATSFFWMNFAAFNYDYKQFIVDENLEKVINKNIFRVYERHYSFNVNDTASVIFAFSKMGLLDSVTPIFPDTSIDYISKSHFYSYDENGFLNKERLLLNNGDSIINTYKFQNEGNI